MTLESRHALRAILNTIDVCDALDEIANMLTEDLASVDITFDLDGATEYAIPREIFDDAYASPAGQYVVNVAEYTDDRTDEYTAEMGES